MGPDLLCKARAGHKLAYMADLILHEGLGPSLNWCTGLGFNSSLGVGARGVIWDWDPIWLKEELYQ